MAIELPDETRREIIDSIKLYFREERDEEIGDLQAGFFLDFILEEVGPSIYNRAVADAQTAMRDAVADLDVNLDQAELGYAARRRAGAIRPRR